MGKSEAIAELSHAGFTESFVWSPAAGGKTLGVDQHFETILGGT